MAHYVGLQLVDAYDNVFTITGIWTVDGKARYELSKNDGRTCVVDYDDVRFLTVNQVAPSR